MDDVIIDNRGDGLFRVHRRVFADANMLALEQQRVFEQCWVYAGHESAMPQRQARAV